MPTCLTIPVPPTTRMCRVSLKIGLGKQTTDTNHRKQSPQNNTAIYICTKSLIHRQFARMK